MMFITVVSVENALTLEATLASLIAQIQTPNELVLLWDEKNPDWAEWKQHKAAVYAGYFSSIHDVTKFFNFELRPVC